MENCRDSKTDPFFSSNSLTPNGGAASALGIKHLFQGQIWTQETGLNDYRNRVELPVMGVFLQPDPIGFKGDAANIYRFCNNNAVNRIDPMGLIAVDFRWSQLMWTQGNSPFTFNQILDAYRNYPAGMNGGGDGVTVRGEHLASNSKEQNASGSNAASDVSLRFTVRHDKTEHYRYDATFYYQLATSSGKPLRGFQYVVTEHTTVLHSNWEVKKSDDKYGKLTRDGFFVDGIGFGGKRPKLGESGSDIRLQTFELHTYDGQKGPPVSTTLRHETILKTNGEVTNEVFGVTP